MKICILIILFFILPAGLLAEIPELIGVIKSDTVNSFFGIRIVPLGDQNNDGYDDFITWSLKYRAYFYYGGDPPISTASLIFDSVGHRINNISDINGDGSCDFSMWGRQPYKYKLNVYYGGADLDTLRDVWFGLDTLQSEGYTVYCNDINQNGTPEIISWSKFGPLTSLMALYELDSPPDSIPEMTIKPPNEAYAYDYAGFGEGIVSGFFNDDSICDLAVNYRPREQDNKSGEIWFYWGGTEFDTIPDLKIKRPGEFAYSYDRFGTVLENLGDVNGDEYDDIFAGYFNSADTLSFLSFGGPDIDTIPDIIFAKYCQKARLAGDINNDGYNDLITGFPNYISGLCRVYLYLGGPEMDSIPDYIFTVNSFDNYYNYIGNDVSGVGDINGDGIDDFAFSAVDAYGTGTIFIYSGWQDPVDVEYDYQAIIPDNFQLHQNYPNPFNQSTVMEFEIPTRQIISLGIYDILGRQIRSLISGSMSAGRYCLTWDGCDKNGLPVSSGIYIYRLKTESSEISKKMILLK